MVSRWLPTGLTMVIRLQLQQQASAALPLPSIGAASGTPAAPLQCPSSTADALLPLPLPLHFHCRCISIASSTPLGTAKSGAAAHATLDSGCWCWHCSDRQAVGDTYRRRLWLGSSRLRPYRHWRPSTAVCMICSVGCVCSVCSLASKSTIAVQEWSMQAERVCWACFALQCNLQTRTVLLPGGEKYFVICRIIAAASLCRGLQHPDC